MRQPSLNEVTESPVARSAATAAADGYGPRSATEKGGKRFVRELVDGERVDSVFLVRERARRPTRQGGEYLRVSLADATGCVEAVAWDDIETIETVCEPGAAVRVSGEYSVHQRYGPKLRLRAVRPAVDDEYDPRDLFDGPPISYERMSDQLDQLIATIQRPHLRTLVERLLAPDSEIGARWRSAPAAKHYHQAYRHGLLEHSLTVAQGVSAMAATFPGIDRDLAVVGALLHDIGKVFTYEDRGGAIEMTDRGRLHGEIALGYYTVRRAIEEIPDFPARDAEALLHIILSHHGKLELGSPVVPCTREAVLVHMIDNLGGTLGSFDRIEKQLPEGEYWSAFDRGIAAAAFFPARASAADEERTTASRVSRASSAGDTGGDPDRLAA